MTGTTVWTLGVSVLITALLPAMYAAFALTGERITGEYNGLALMRCSLSPKNLSMKFVEWYKGSQIYGTMVYIDVRGQPQKHDKRGNRGPFKGRNITGKFSPDGTFYDLSILSAQPVDFDNYSCHARTWTERFRHTFIQLTLVAPPEEPPAITDKYGTIQRTSNCSDLHSIPIITVDRHPSFICQVGRARPYPSIEWHYDGKCIIHNMSLSSEYNDTGVLKKSAKRQIDVMLLENNTLVCTVKVPDARTGRLEELNLCLRVVESSPRVDPVLFYIIPLVVLIVVWVVLLRRYVTLKRKDDEKHITRYLLMIQVGLINSAGHLCMGFFVILYTFIQCSVNLYIDGYTEKRSTRSFMPIVILVYLAIRFVVGALGMLVAIFKNWKHTQDSQMLAKDIYKAVIFFCGPSYLLILQKSGTSNGGKKKKVPTATLR